MKNSPNIRKSSKEMHTSK